MPERHVRAARGIIALAIACVAFVFRFQRPDFYNDHFEHLSMARQVLFGELPGRDFFDPGRPLTVLLSAGAQAVSGHSLFGEALLTIGALALGAAITFWLASGISRSVVAGVLAALLVIVISPRLYSYPKIIVFAVALLALWRYVDRPSMGRTVTVAVVTVFALLMRHDFGLYVALASTCTFVCTVVASAGRYRRSLFVYVVTASILVAPYLLWMQQNGLLASSTAAGASSLAGAARITWPPLHLRLSNGIMHVSPVRGRVAVRWSSTTAPDERTALEHRYHLVNGEAGGETTWTYGIEDDSRENLRALVADPHVDDTSGINRGAATLDVPVAHRVLSRLGVTRIVVGPFFTAEEAESWIYYVFLLIPIAALAVLVAEWRRGVAPPEWNKVVSASVLGILLNLFLLRGSLDSRLPDVVVPAAVMGAWLLARMVRAAARRDVPVRLLTAGGVTIAFVLVGSAVTAYTGMSGIPSLGRSRLREVARDLRMRPIDAWAPPGSDGVKALTRYVFECTRDDDRLLLVAYEPQVFYYSERLFAGGIEHFHQRRFSSPVEQAKVIAILGRQHVPLVIVEDVRAQMLAQDYAQVAGYIGSRYMAAAETRFGSDRLWRIYVDRALKPVSRGDLPCFR